MACRAPFHRAGGTAARDGWALRDRRRPFIKLNTMTGLLLGSCDGRMTATTLVMAIFYMLESLISEGILELYADSSMASAMVRMIAIASVGVEDAALDARARTCAAAMIQECRRRGYYVPVEVAPSACDQELGRGFRLRRSATGSTIAPPPLPSRLM